jgi:hypothetical protein
MFEQALLRDQVEQLVDKTQRLADLYQQLADQCAEPIGRDTLAKLSREKHRNLDLAERMREVLD